MYVFPNFKTKKALKEAVLEGRKVSVYQPNNIFGVVVPQSGIICVEGPHHPEPHKWYATVWIENGLVVKVK